MRKNGHPRLGLDKQMSCLGFMLIYLYNMTLFMICVSRVNGPDANHATRSA
jgi:hypothetical protein